MDHPTTSDDAQARTVPDPKQFIFGLIYDVVQALEAHGYGPFDGRQLVELGQHLIHHLHGRGDRCYGKSAVTSSRHPSRRLGEPSPRRGDTSYHRRLEHAGAPRSSSSGLPGVGRRRDSPHRRRAGPPLQPHSPLGAGTRSARSRRRLPELTAPSHPVVGDPGCQQKQPGLRASDPEPGAGRYAGGHGVSPPERKHSLPCAHRPSRRKRQPGQQRQGLPILARRDHHALVALVALVAAAASYGHLLNVAPMAGENPWIAKAFPITVDGLVLAAHSGAAGTADAGSPWAPPSPYQPTSSPSSPRWPPQPARRLRLATPGPLRHPPTSSRSRATTVSEPCPTSSNRPAGWSRIRTYVRIPPFTIPAALTTLSVRWWTGAASLAFALHGIREATGWRTMPCMRTRLARSTSSRWRR